MIRTSRCFERGCLNYIGVLNFGGDTEEDERHTCHAFPEGIPEEINYGDDMHFSVQEGQQGLFVFDVG